jgi:hypothetical protein
MRLPTDRVVPSRADPQKIGHFTCVVRLACEPYKVGRAIGFLCDDLQVRVRSRFKGRQKAHKEIGLEVVQSQ